MLDQDRAGRHLMEELKGKPRLTPWEQEAAFENQHPEFEGKVPLLLGIVQEHLRRQQGVLGKASVSRGDISSIKPDEAYKHFGHCRECSDTYAHQLVGIHHSAEVF